MIIDNLDIHRSRRSLRPSETNPPLVVDADRVLPGSVALERLESIAGQSSKIGQRRRGLETVEPFGPFGVGPAEPIVSGDQTLAMQPRRAALAVAAPIDEAGRLRYFEVFGDGRLREWGGSC